MQDNSADTYSGRDVPQRDGHEGNYYKKHDKLADYTKDAIKTLEGLYDKPASKDAYATEGPHKASEPRPKKTAEERRMEKLAKQRRKKMEEEQKKNSRAAVNEPLEVVA